MKTILIGFGDIAEKHIQVLKKLDCQITGIFSRTYENTLHRSKKFGHFNIFKSIEEAKSTECDFYFILPSAENNCKVLKEFLPIKKPILIEKPVGFSSTELKQAITMNKKYKVPVMVAVNRRFYSIFNKALEYLHKKNKKINAIYVEAPERFRDIYHPKFSPNIKKHWMYTNSIHCIDLIRFFAGDIKEITSYSNPSKFVFNAVGLSKNDINFIYNSNWKSPGSWSVTLYANETKIIFNPLEKGHIIEKDGSKTIEPAKEDVQFKPGFYFQLKHFLDNVINKNEFSWPCSNLADHKLTLDLIEKIYGTKLEI